MLLKAVHNICNDDSVLYFMRFFRFFLFHISIFNAFGSITAFYLWNLIWISYRIADKSKKIPFNWYLQNSLFYFSTVIFILIYFFFQKMPKILTFILIHFQFSYQQYLIPRRAKKRRNFSFISYFLITCIESIPIDFREIDNFIRYLCKAKVFVIFYMFVFLNESLCLAKC